MRRLTAAVMFILTARSSLIPALTMITRQLIYAATCASPPVCRSRTNTPEAKFIAPFGIIASSLSLLLIAWLLTDVNFRKKILTLGGAAVGLILHFAHRFYRARFS